ncbi:26S proteasome regulatory complex, non-ATPase subcomplex, Rpn2/Psmd1 subunit [Jaminaea rosea]|uniref:26S proteasome regulatory subunit RPN2 n=1 Tax=Jaminaea rosea TaxID=1569628 RepID=A0A316UU82_9BASI|nr:26S proteasome regulatory complex, non-ATPase subcomplex, Rpn2/Psmd1 subunit [Jaminaea rosea]PWN27463.1 26S proteasome regulatory complex, non-ATPase subcomplex, Rpn2/Psmd1 subunit [Jaminaea rosea]
MVASTSAAGLLSLLDEPEAEIQAYAIAELDKSVHQFWAEIADNIDRIEILSEASSPLDSATRNLASLLASKVYFHLGEFDDALTFALGADEAFNVDAGDEYTESIVSKAIESYIEQNSATDGPQPDARLVKIVNSMFTRCINAGEYKPAIGIALETRRLDTIEAVFEHTGRKDQELLSYTLEAVMGIGGVGFVFRQQVLRLLIKLFQSLPHPDNFSIAQCFVYLGAPTEVADLLLSLVKQGHEAASASSTANSERDPLLIAYQCAFDLAESATQEFLETVRVDLASKAGGDSSAGEMQTDDNAASSSSTVAGCVSRIRSILLGEESIQLYLDFLIRSNHSDLTVLKSVKESLDARNSIYHSAMTFSNAFMNAGTTSDRFLRENLDWLAKASNWSKFTATAALGVINKGNLKEGLTILRPYLPQDGFTSSAYSEGGSLFALGLIHANHGTEVMDLLTNQIKTNEGEIVLHGAALGIGAAGMATGSLEVYEELRNRLYSDSAVAGEAAGYAMGMVMLGTANQRAVEEMLQYAHETQHEKIIRGLAMGLALLFYGLEDKADTMIDTLLGDKDPILRYGGVYTIALAYAGTGDNKAIRRLLHIAVSDTSDDVRRAAVTSLGFLLFRNPTQVPRIVQLLSESYNPHVRYGSTLALGIACASTGLDEAVDLLMPMAKDPVDFVRQGAYIALSLIMLQQNSELNPRVTEIRELYSKVLGDKHEEPMAKFGAALSSGLIDAGGRNVTCSLQSRIGGNNNMMGIVGMALFTQFWYWFPMAHFASLAFSPTALIGLDRELRIPDFEFVSNARPSLFRYPETTKKDKEKKVEKVETAVLSTTARARQRQKAKEREKAVKEGMDVDDVKPAVGAGKADADSEMKDASTDTPASAAKKPRRKPAEPTSERLQNYSRVTPAQSKFVAFPSDSRYTPVRAVQGISTTKTNFHDDSANPVGVKGALGLLGNATPKQGESGTATPLGQQKDLKAGAQASAATAKPAAPTGATTAAASALTPDEIRKLRSRSSGGSGAGILLLVDRRSTDSFRGLRVSGGDEGGDAAAAGAANGATAPAGNDELSEADRAAIEAALAGDDENIGEEKANINSVRDQQEQGRRDGPGGGAAPGGGGPPAAH